jgi:hypothetical protein
MDLKLIQRIALLLAIVSCFVDAIYTSIALHVPLPSQMNFQSGLLLIILGMQFEIYYHKRNSDMTFNKQLSDNKPTE